MGGGWDHLHMIYWSYICKYLDSILCIWNSHVAPTEDPSELQTFLDQHCRLYSYSFTGFLLHVQTQFAHTVFRAAHVDPCCSCASRHAKQLNVVLVSVRMQHSVTVPHHHLKSDMFKMWMFRTSSDVEKEMHYTSVIKPRPRGLWFHHALSVGVCVWMHVGWKQVSIFCCIFFEVSIVVLGARSLTSSNHVRLM